MQLMHTLSKHNTSSGKQKQTFLNRLLTCPLYLYQTENGQQCFSCKQWFSPCSHAIKCFSDDEYWSKHMVFFSQVYTISGHSLLEIQQRDSTIALLTALFLPLCKRLRAESLRTMLRTKRADLWQYFNFNHRY